MLSVSVVEEIARHLAEGKLSQREIARRLGVGRATVSAIARGKRGLYGRSEEPPSLEPDPLDPPERCAHCGYRVRLPCLVCRVREYRRGRRILAAHALRRPRPVRGERGGNYQRRPRKSNACRRAVA